MQRTSYQNGSVVRKPRQKGPDVWVYRYKDSEGKYKSETIGTVEKYQTKAAATKRAAKLREEINDRVDCIKVSGLCDRFLEDGMKDIRPHSQATYRSFTKRVNMEFGEWRVDELAKDIKAIEDWLNGYQTLPVPERKDAKGNVAAAARPARDVSKKTKLHLKAFVHRLLELAIKWGYLTLQRNPITLVEVKGRRKRVRIHTLLTGEQYRNLIADPELCEHVRVMIQVAMILGLRASEILGLRWENIDFVGKEIKVCISVVEKDADDTKTETSEEKMPMHEELEGLLQAWFEECKAEDAKWQAMNGWVFGNTLTGRPYWRGSLQKDHLVPAGKKIGIASLGWHDFRHTYRAIMGEEEIPLEMQKTLMRHSDISTTLDYGRGKGPTKKMREANARVVEMLKRRA